VVVTTDRIIQFVILVFVASIYTLLVETAMRQRRLESYVLATDLRTSAIYHNTFCTDAAHHESEKLFCGSKFKNAEDLPTDKVELKINEEEFMRK
jgi:hypothetical protein